MSATTSNNGVVLLEIQKDGTLKTLTQGINIRNGTRLRSVPYCSRKADRPATITAKDWHLLSSENHHETRTAAWICYCFNCALMQRYNRLRNG